MKTLSSFAAAAVLLTSTACVASPKSEAASASAVAVEDAEFEAVRKEIWAKELAIYQGRGRGDLSIYLSSTADGFSAWPPHYDEPKGNDGLQQTQQVMEGLNQERLEMNFVSLVLNGDTAIVYYKTHRTMQADGTPADQRYDVTHTWVRQDGEWKVLGGMARLRSDAKVAQ